MLIVVPTRRSAARVADRALGAAGGPRAVWTGDVVTLGDLVDRALSADPEPRRRLGRAGSALLAAEILRDLEADALRLFGPGIEGAGAARAIAAAVAEMRAAGLRAIDLAPAARDARRIAALAAVLDAWERRLDSGGILDEAESTRRAASLVERAAWPAGTIDALEVRDLHDASFLQGELLLALARRARRVRVRIPFDPHDPATTAFAYPYVHLWESLDRPDLDVELSFFEAREEGRPDVRLRAEPDPLEEARHAADDARAWIDEGVPAEEIAIIVPSRATRLGALTRELERRGVPHHARRATPLLERAGVVAALLPFALLEEGYPRERIETWVASPLTRALDPRLLLPAVSAGPPAGATREDWNRALSAARGDSARRLVSALRSIEDLGASEAAPHAFWPRYVEVLAGVGLLEGLSDRDPAGLAAWERALLSLRGAHESLGTWERPARGWRAHRRSLIDVLVDVWAPIGRAGRGVEILTARDARGLEFRRQRLVGLVQGSLTRPSPAAAILGDSERRTLNRAIGRAAFRTSADESLEGDLLLAERLRATGERIVVSWPVEDESATPLLPALEVERERERRGTPPPQPPAHAQPPAWRAVRRADVVTELMEIERERTRFFARPPAERRATAGRWSGAFDPATAGLLAEEVRGGRLAAWSASALETWSACAHRWFQGYLLGLRPPDERPLEAEPRTTGDLAHLALKRLFADEGGATDLARVQAAVDAAADEVADARRGPPAVWATTRRRVAISLHRYLRAMAEEAKSGRVPAALEESFGREGSRTPGIELDTSLGRVSLRGTIDRIDRDPETGDLHVIDYKYSLKGREHTEAVDPERCGVERFQLYAYFLGALGWAEEMGLETGSVTGEIHCIRSAAVAGPLAMPDPLVVRAGIARAVEAAVGGVYDPTPRDAKRCRLCDFRRGCRISTVVGAFPEEDEGT